MDRHYEAHTLEIETKAPITFSATEYISYKPKEVQDYDGPYRVVPSNTTQTLKTSGKMMREDVTIEKIPSCYGLISWNGTTLTVS